MKQDRPEPREPGDTLRDRAAERLRQAQASPDAARNDQDRAVLLQELQIHQIELEMQNDELRRALEEVESHRLRYVDLYDFAPVGYFSLDREGRILAVNLTGASQLGVPRSRLVRTNFLKFVGESESPEFRQFLADVFDGRETHELTLMRRTSTGTFFARLTAGASPEGTECRLILTDITAQRLAEQEVSSLAIQLQESRKLESIGRLAGGVAHDFNNFLTVINGYGDLVLGDLASTDPARPSLEKMRKAGDKAAALTRQLLAFGRRQPLHPEELDLSEVVAEFEPLLRRVTGVEIEFTTTLPPQLSRVEADRSQLEQVLMNVVVNARDAMPQGGKLTIETSHITSTAGGAKRGSRRSVMLTIRDTGTGMNTEVQEHLFEPFFTTKPVGMGTGLGLAVVYGIVKQSGGSIQVESEPGEGTTIRISFPCVAGAPLTATENTTAEVAPHGSGTILLVEDQEEVRELTATILEGAGYLVIQAENGREGLNQSGSHVGTIDLVVSDVIMPHLGGGEMFQQLRLKRPGIRVLFMSGFSGSMISDRVLPDSSIRCLQKPFTPAELLEAVHQCMKDPPPTW